MWCHTCYEKAWTAERRRRRRKEVPGVWQDFEMIEMLAALGSRGLEWQWSHSRPEPAHTYNLEIQDKINGKTNAPHSEPPNGGHTQDQNFVL